MQAKQHAAISLEKAGARMSALLNAQWDPDDSAD